MWVCKNCGSAIDNDRLLSCWNCGYGKDGSPPADKAALDEAKSVKADPRSPRLPPRPRALISSGRVSTLRIFGWVALVAAILGAAIIFFNWLSRPKWKEDDGLYSLFVALAVAFQGTFVFVLCQVIADVADDVQMIRSELFSRR